MKFLSILTIIIALVLNAESSRKIERKAYRSTDEDLQEETRNINEIHDSFDSRFGKLEPIERGGIAYPFKLASLDPEITSKYILKATPLLPFPSDLKDDSNGKDSKARTLGWWADQEFSTMDETYFTHKMSKVPNHVKLVEAFGGNMLRMMRAHCQSFICKELIRSKFEGLPEDEIDTQFMILQKVEGESLHTFSGGRVFNQMGYQESGHFMLSSLIQIFHLIQAGHEVDFYHFDIHMRNVIFDKPIDERDCSMASEKLFRYEIGSRVIQIPADWTCGAQLILIDHGMSAEIGDGKFLGPSQRDMDKKRALTSQLRVAMIHLLGILSCHIVKGWEYWDQKSNNEVPDIINTFIRRIFKADPDVPWDRLPQMKHIVKELRKKRDKVEFPTYKTFCNPIGVSPKHHLLKTWDIARDYVWNQETLTDPVDSVEEILSGILLK